jgi:hypothetical protein
MSATYRDDREAALSRAEVLNRENEVLRAENFWLRAQVDPAGAEGVHWMRGALVALAVLLTTTVGASIILRDMAAHTADSSAPSFDLPERPFPDEALQRALAGAPPVVADRPAEAAPEAPPPSERASLTVALTPLLQGCFAGPRSRVDLVATVDSRGRAQRVYVLHHGQPGARRAERRCVRRALEAVSLPTARGDFTSYGPNTELHLVLLPARIGRSHGPRRG